jgi:hypothetical protein
MTSFCRRVIAMDTIVANKKRTEEIILVAPNQSRLQRVCPIWECISRVLFRHGFGVATGKHSLPAAFCEEMVVAAVAGPSRLLRTRRKFWIRS